MIEKINRQIPEEKLESIHIEMNGKEPCYKGKIVINGVELGRGVKSVHLTLDAELTPVVSIEYSEKLIDPIEKKLLGLS